MRKLLSFLWLMLLALTAFAQQSKCVYITLDVSGSMTGDKYLLANYTAQMIVALCDEDDDVYMIVMGDKKHLSKEADPLRLLQVPMGDIGSVFRRKHDPNQEIEDIEAFNKDYTPSKGKQDWLFIIGDGDWWNDHEIKRKFKKIVAKGTLNVCYLQTAHTLDEEYDFTKFAQSLGVVDIDKSSLDPKTILHGCDHFTKKILGFSEVSIDLKKQSAQCISFDAELPVKEFLIVYQDGVEAKNLPDIQNVKANGENLSFTLKGTPTNFPCHTGDPTSGLLSGHVWRVKALGSIPANTLIEVCFDKNIRLDDVRVYPLVEQIEFGSVCFTPVGSRLRQLDSNTLSICRDEKTARIRVELSEESKAHLPEPLLQKTVVVVKANNKDYPTQYVDGGFECDLELLENETQYYAECDCPGYFKHLTPIMTIVKGDCLSEMPKVKVTEMPVTDFGTVTFERLKHDYIETQIHDESSWETLDPNQFDLTVEVENDFLYEKPTIRVEGDKLIIDIHPKGEWCECIFPKDLNFKVVSMQKEGEYSEEGKIYGKTIHPVHLTVEKQRAWLPRCLWVLATIGGALLLSLYCWIMMRKRRFKKNALMAPYYVNRDDDLVEQNGQMLRKKGIGPWFCRWFLPMDEKRRVNMDRPRCSMTFVAADARNVVNIPRSCYDSESMTITGYNPRTDGKKSPYIKLGSNGKIVFNKPNGEMDGQLVFKAGSRNDEGLYKTILGALIIVALLTAAVLLILMLRSL